MPAKLVAEFIGTFTLIFAGVGSAYALAQATDGGAALIAVALAHGLAIAVMVSALGHVSGAHFNPAVSLALGLTGKMPWAHVPTYVVAQLAGAAAAAAAINWSWTEKLIAEAPVGVPMVGADLSAGTGVLVEAILTFLLVWVIFAVAVDHRGSYSMIAGLPIGLMISVDILAGGPLTGAAMNPARAFGPELMSTTWTDWWVYWVGPILGGSLAAFLYTAVVAPGRDEPLTGDSN